MHIFRSPRHAETLTSWSSQTLDLGPYMEHVVNARSCTYRVAEALSGISLTSQKPFHSRKPDLYYSAPQSIAAPWCGPVRSVACSTDPKLKALPQISRNLFHRVLRQVWGGAEEIDGNEVV